MSAHNIRKTDTCYQPDTNDTRKKQNQKKIKGLRKKVTKRDITYEKLTRVTNLTQMTQERSKTRRKSRE